MRRPFAVRFALALSGTVGSARSRSHTIVQLVGADPHHREGGRGETTVARMANGPFTTTMRSR